MPVLAGFTLPLLQACAGRSAAAPDGPSGSRAVVLAVADEVERQFVAQAADTAAWPSVTEASAERAARQHEQWARALERVDGASLAGTSEWALHANLLERSRTQLAQRVCRFELWPLSTFSGWHLAMAEVARAGRFDTDSGRTRNVARFRALPAHLESEMARLRRGAAAGYTTPAPVVRSVMAQLDALLPADPRNSPLDAPAERAGDIAAQWRALVRDTVYPAVTRFRAFLSDEYLPRARPEGSLTTQRDGAACYRALLRTIAGRDVDPAAVMADARQFLDSLLRELGPSARRLAGTDDTFEAIRLLRADPRFTVPNRDSLLGLYRAAMDRARAAMPAFFSHVTQVPVVVEPHGPAQERAGFPAQYSAAPFDRSRPARVFVNLARNDRMNVGLAVAHEGFPGHHQERAMQSELPRPHPVIRRLFNSGYTEGWGLYSEWLADTMGIYASELERVGYQIHLTDAALGAILDIGYHSLGWSRDALVDSMMATGGRSRPLAEAYADRHAATPSQIATYHIGYRAITTARREARERLGARFDLRGFHTAVLDEGVLTLPALQDKLRRWPGPAAAGSGQSAITRDDLAARLGILAHDSMLGREAGQLGNVKATDYIAAELRRLGVEPAGEDGGYFQVAPLIHRTIDPQTSLQAGGTTVGGDQAVPLRPIGGNPLGGGWLGRNVPLVFGGRLGSPNMVPPESVGGAVVLFLPAQNAAGAIAANLTGPGGALTRYGQAAAVLIAGLEGAAPFVQSFLRQPRVMLNDPAVLGAASIAAAALTSPAAERLAGRPLEQLVAGQALGHISGRIGFRDAAAPHPARNVVGIVRGRDAGRNQTYVAIGAHTDHDGIGPVLEHDSVRAFNTVMRPLGANDPVRQPDAAQAARIAALRDSLRALRPPRADSIFNGADDDASGVAVMLELAEYFQANRPDRSLLLVFHTAEEKGLFGAAYYTEHPTVARDSIIAMVNLDQVSRGGPDDVPGSLPNSVYLLGSRRLSTALGDLVEAVNGRGHNLRLDYSYDTDGHPANGYCRSDHYMYARFGIPVVFLSAGWHRDYHMVTDEPQYSSIETMYRISGFVRDLVHDVAALGARPLVDRPRPDPRAPCRQ